MNPLFDKLDQMGLKPLDDPNDRPIVSQSDVEKLEKEFGYTFPKLYVEFLLRYGLSIFEGDTALFEVPDDWDELTDELGYDGWHDVRVFYGLNTEREDDIWNLKSAISSSHADALPSHLLPICESDGMPTVVYLSCREHEYGHVYALTREQIWELSTQEAEQAAFHLADSFEEFLEHIYLNSHDGGEPSPFHSAMIAGDVAFLQRIVDSGEAENYRNEYGFTLLQSAIMSMMVWPVEFLLEHNTPTKGDLSTAIQNGNINAIKLLIEHGIDINAPIPLNKEASQWQTPLIQVVQSELYDKKYEIAQLLIDSGADVDTVDSAGKKALDYVHPLNQKMRAILT